LVEDGVDLGVYINPVARVQQRVALGGHAVPENRIATRYQRSLQLLPAAAVQCNRVVLFDNSYRASPGGTVKLAPFCEILRDDPNRSKFSIVTRDTNHTPRWASTPLRILEASL